MTSTGVVTAPGVADPRGPSGRVTTAWIVAAATAVGFVAALYPVFEPHGSMTVYGYDGSVYLGASVRLLHGVLPYRDFVFVQPPGIVLLMTPVSLLALGLGTDAGLWLARLVTIFVMAANCGLVAWLLRRLGPAASLSGGLYLALFTVASSADSQLKLEPYLALCCLVGAALLFEGDGVTADRRRALWAGVAIGVAGLVKLWAIFPAAVMVLLVVLLRRTALNRFVLGMVAAFGAGAIVFVLAAPSAFVRDVLVTQLSPSSGRGAGTGIVGRVRYLAESDLRPLVEWFPASSSSASLWVAALAVAVVVLVLALRRARMTALEWFAIGSSALSILALLVSPHYSTYYLYLQAPFVGLLVGVVVGEGATRLRSIGIRRPRTARAIAVGGAALLAVLAVALWRDQAATDRAYVGATALSGSLSFVDTAIPSGSCVVTSDAYLTLATDRFDPSSEGCPAVVDAYGTWFAADPSDPPPTASSHVPGLTGQWAKMLSSAQYLVLDSWTESYIPWDRTLRAWFAANYTPVGSGAGVTVYRNEFVSPR